MGYAVLEGTRAIGEHVAVRPNFEPGSYVSLRPIAWHIECTQERRRCYNR